MPGGFSYLGNFKITDSSGEIVSQSVGSSALLSTCADAQTIEVDSSTGKLQIPVQGSSAANGVQRAKMSKYAGVWLQGALTASDSGGGVFSVQNTYGSNLIVTRVLLYVTTVSSGACTLDIGFAANATTVADTLIDGLDVNSATGVFDNIDDKGTNGEPRGLWTSGGSFDYINASMKTGATSGLVGFYGIHVIDLSA